MKILKYTRIIGLISMPIFWGCTSQTDTIVSKNTAYFDLRGFMNDEIKKLHQSSPEIIKKVQSNQNTEEKVLKIENWEEELKNFVEADINKSSWIGYFEIKHNGHKTTYTALKAEIPIKKIEIWKNSTQKIQHLTISIENSNMLYHSKDTLIYYPDSLYMIQKWQKTRFLSEKWYRIEGTLVQKN